MPWTGLSEGSHKSDPKYWAPQLAKAREYLWNRKIENAGKLFTKISNELKRVRPKGLNDEILITKAESRLGLWAVEYLNFSQERAEYKSILAGVQPTFRLWLFVANVFTLDLDTSPDALFAYQELLRCKPSEKYALVILGILQKAEFTSAATDLLETIIGIIPNDLNIAGWFCRWSLKSNRIEKAEEIARRILGRDPNHIDANRCLGYLAEVRQQWPTACEYFLRSQNWLRVAVCYNHLENHLETLIALRKVDLQKQKNSTWLYHAGWASFKQGDLENAKKYWQDLGAYSPKQKSGLLSKVEELSFFQHLTDISKLEHPMPEAMPEEYESEAHLRRGAVRLMLKRDPKSADEDFRRIAPKYPKYSLPNIYYLASINCEKEDLALDKSTFEKLKKIYPDASIYLLLRCLWLAPSRADIALLYLEKSLQEGLAQSIPTQAITAIQWLLSKLAKNNATMAKAENLLFLDQRDKKPVTEDLFFGAIRSSLTWKMLKNNSKEEIPWVLSINNYKYHYPTSWNRIKAAYYALDSAWIPAIDTIQSEQIPEYEDKLFSQGIYQSSRRKEWQITAELLDRALKKHPNDHTYNDLSAKLQEAMMHRFWHKRDYSSVERQLQNMLIAHPGDSHIHHDLAILYTQWALSQDQKNIPGIPSDLWNRSIGHWAVVLSDTHYWISWKNNRQWIEGTSIDNTAINNLIDITIPELLRNYFNECELRIDAKKFRKTHYYSVLIEQELDTMTAIRMLLRQAGKKNLPEEICRWLSPCLVKEYAGEKIAEKLQESLPQFKLSTADSHQIRLAFSPLWEIHVLACSDQPEVALEKIQALESEQVLTQEKKTEISDERIFILEKYTRKSIDRLQWDEAIKHAQELWQLRPGQEFAEKLLIEAGSGWVQERLHAEDNENAVTRLKEIIKSLHSESVELNALLAEALAHWGLEALEQDKANLAQKRFEEALSLDSANLIGRHGMVRVYFTFVVVASEKGDKKTAYQHARQIYAYEQTRDTATIFAHACAQYAIQLYQINNFQDAIQILDPALQLPYDQSEFQLEELMSEILTNYGAELFNSGQRSEAISIMQQAVQLDPENEVAKQNLTRSGGWY